MNARVLMIAASAVATTLITLGLGAEPTAAVAPGSYTTVAAVHVPALVAMAKRPAAPKPKDPTFPVCDGSIGPLVNSISSRCIVRWKAAAPRGSRVTKYILRIRTVDRWDQSGLNVATWKPVGVGAWSAKRVVSRKARSYIFSQLAPGEYQVKLVAKNAKGTSAATYFVASLDSRGV